MHRHFVAAVSWCVVIAAAATLIVEVHRDHRQPQPVVVSSVTTARTVTAVSPPAPASPDAPSDAHAYAGNTNSKKFHLRTCRYYSCKNCKAYFATREEAIAAGYSPAGCCDP